MELARCSPTDPRTLTRAARDFVAKHKRPEFAMAAGFCALGWMARGHGYELTGVLVFMLLLTISCRPRAA